MSFKRDGRLEHRWKQWVKKHQRFLTHKCGLPLLIVNDREEWYHFLDHGFSREVDFSPLTDCQCTALVSFLSEHEGADFGPLSRMSLRSLCYFLGRDETLLEPGFCGS